MNSRSLSTREKEAGIELSKVASGPEQARLSGPFFEIGPKNLLRRAELEGLARAAGAAGYDCGVSVILTVPTALIAPIHDLRSGVLTFAQAMAPDPPGDSMGRVIAETLVDAGAAGVWAIPAEVINPAPRAETRIRVRFMRSVVLLQNFDRFDRSVARYKILGE